MHCYGPPSELSYFANLKGARKFLCRHRVAEIKDTKVINTAHRRDQSKKLKDVMADIAALFSNAALAAEYFELIRQVKGRYLRDQVQAIREAILGRNKELVNKVLETCVSERYLCARIFSELLTMQEAKDASITAPVGKVILLDPTSTRKAEIKPDKSDLDEYEKAFGKS